MEVLSPSTRNFDRGEKGRLYRALPSLAGYLLIDQKPAEIEYFRRLPNGNWEVAAISDINARLTLDALGCELPVSDIYRGPDLL